MKAIRVQAYGGPEQLRYEDVPKPQIEPGQVLVRVHAASVNPVDYKLASGKYRRGSPETPWIPGGDFSGVVEEIGAGVTNVKRGDEVFGDCRPGGGYAEFVATAAEWIALKPRTLSHVEAASVPLAGQTAWQGLFDHGRLQAGQTVLIHGTPGGVGTFAVQLARWKGARVLTTGRAEDEEFLRELGAGEVIDYRMVPFETVARDVDLVLDLIGGETLERSYGIVKPGGYLITAVQEPSEEAARERGIHAANFMMQPTTENLRQLAELVDAGTIKPVVFRTYPLAEAARAWETLLHEHKHGKIVLEVI